MCLPPTTPEFTSLFLGLSPVETPGLIMSMTPGLGLVSALLAKAAHRDEIHTTSPIFCIRKCRTLNSEEVCERGKTVLKCDFGKFN